MNVVDRMTGSGPRCCSRAIVALVALCGCADGAPPAPSEVAAVQEASVEVEGGARQIAAAVTAAPPDLRDGAAVRGYDEQGELVLLRTGTNGLTCLADAPGDERFQVVCYHDSLEPYMARGRALRAEGIDGPDNLAVRHAEIDAGELSMPAGAAMIYNLGGPPEMHDSETGEVDEARGRRVYSAYVAYATEASTGLSTTPPVRGAPWIMRPGTPSAHIMVVLDPESAGDDAG